MNNPLHIKSKMTARVFELLDKLGVKCEITNAPNVATFVYHDLRMFAFTDLEDNEFMLTATIFLEGSEEEQMETAERLQSFVDTIPECQEVTACGDGIGHISCAWSQVPKFTSLELVDLLGILDAFFSTYNTIVDSDEMVYDCFQAED
jgi:hypothetical protein